MSKKKETTVFRMVAKTLSGLEDILTDELRVLGAQGVRPMNRSVEFTGDTRILYKANLWLRTATRILAPIKTFRAPHQDALYRHIQEVDWSLYMGPESTLAIDALVNQTPAFTNSLFVAQKAKDAIVDQFRHRTGKRPSVDTKFPDLRINLYIHDNQATLSLDSSGQPLSRRGYRTDKGKAPINEVLAAGIIALTEWDMESSFVDGMCGSGTFVIEAALKARNIAPGLNRREFGFMRWPNYDEALFTELHEKARAAMRPDLPFEIVGSDKSSKAVAEAAANASRAGVARDIRLEHTPLEDLTPPEPGVLVMNPPYGERLPVEDIEALYSLIGDTLKQNFNGYDAFIFTGSAKAAKRVGLRTSRRIQLNNGPLECRLLKYEIYQGTRKLKKLERQGSEDEQP